MTILTLLAGIAKKNQTGEIRCQVCHRRTGIHRHGCYYRYLFHLGELAPIQRYRCLNPDCSCVTFSILPHPFLRYIRLPLCVLFVLLDSSEEKTSNLSALSRETGLSRPAVVRGIGLARRLRAWTEQLALWPNGGRPCLDPARRWTAFNRALSWAFFPGRYGRPAPHTI
jgi:hypothetical protein